MNILVVHETEYIKKMVFEYQIIPEIWASHGHKVFVIDFETNWKRSNIFDLISRNKTVKNVKVANKKNGVTLIRPWFIKIAGLSRISAAISHYFTIKKTIRQKKIDVLFLYSVPTNGLQAVRAARVCKTPVYFRLLDVLHQLVPSRMLSRPTYRLEKMVYKRVDELTAITPRLTKYAISLGSNPKTSSYLPSGHDADLFYPAPKSHELQIKYNIKKSDQVIVFAGTLYDFSGLDKVLRYFAKHKSQFMKTKFIIAGSGKQQSTLEKIIRENHIEKNVFLTGFIDYRNLNDYLNLADICINPFAINKVTEIIFPGKIYQYLACQKPVIATKLPGLVDLFPDNGGKNGIYYYNEKKISGFFSLIKSIKTNNFIISEPSLQDIAQIIENRFKRLISAEKK